MGVEEDQKIDRTQSTKQEIIMCEGRRREKGKDVGGERAEFWGKAGFGALVNHIDEGLPTWMKECPKSGETLDRDMDPQDQRPDLIKLEGEGDASSGIATHIRRPGPDNRDFFAFRYDN